MWRETYKILLYKTGSSALAVAAVPLAWCLRPVPETPAPPRPVAESPAPVLELLLDRAHKEHRAAPKPERQPQPLVGARVSVSLYERTTSPAALQRQGCRAGGRDVGGLTILDFGKPAWNGHTNGTILFSNRFASNVAITRAVYAFAFGYVKCLPKTSERRIVLARGTSNYHISVPDTVRAGRAWARETTVLARRLAAHPNIAAHVASAAAIDAEPAWDRTFTRTRRFFRGYRAAHGASTIYNYGSLDGGVGSIWNAEQAAFVASGRYTRAVPEIYNHAMAEQWAYLAKVARRQKREVRFAGVMTQHHARCGCSLKPHAARRALVRALAVHVGENAPSVPPMLTNIRGA